MDSTKKLIVASGNAGKMREIRAICSDLNITIDSLEDAFGEKIDIPETGTTFLENATLKANWVRERKECWVLADDSGLMVDALNGEPGVYSARYAGESCNDKDNIVKLLNALKDVDAENRGAKFVSQMVLLGPNGESVDVVGECHGTISQEKSGNNGFGYDPIFIPEGYSQSFATLDEESKNKISHRGEALKKLRGKLDVIFS